MTIENVHYADTGVKNNEDVHYLKIEVAGPPFKQQLNMFIMELLLVLLILLLLLVLISTITSTISTTTVISSSMIITMCYNVYYD